jgi:hypothetical protein
MTTVILLNAIPAVFVLVALTLICWTPSRLRRSSDQRIAQLTPRRPVADWEYEERRAA